jgi:Secreted repeat of unknown function
VAIVMEKTRRAGLNWQRLGLRVAGAGLLAVTGAIHLDLYLAGYRYSFAPDTPSRSNCNGTCAGYWPPVTGTPAAGPGVTGKLGTIKRSDGATQATYDGHPLYTYIADTAPGQAHPEQHDHQAGPDQHRGGFSTGR